MMMMTTTTTTTTTIAMIVMIAILMMKTKTKTRWMRHEVCQSTILPMLMRSTMAEARTRDISKATGTGTETASWRGATWSQQENVSGVEACAQRNQKSEAWEWIWE